MLCISQLVVVALHRVLTLVVVEQEDYKQMILAYILELFLHHSILIVQLH